jgi:hypothetical protein
MRPAFHLDNEGSNAMPLTPDSEPETVEEALQDAAMSVQEHIEEIVLSQPVKSLAIAFAAGIVIGKLVL